MKKVSTYFILLLTFYYSVTYTSENKKYEILNEIIRDNNFTFDKVCKKAKTITVFENNTGEFSIFDQLYVFTQKTLQGQYELKEGKIFYYTYNSEKRTAPIVDSCDRKLDFVYKISLPVVSSDNTTAMINITQDCNCMLGGYGGTFVFRKENGKWKQIKSYNEWIS